MIWTPDRLAGVIDTVERGEPVDTKRLAALFALDVARAGREFAQESIREQEAADDEYAKQFRAADPS